MGAVIKFDSVILFKPSQNLVHNEGLNVRNTEL